MPLRACRPFRACRRSARLLPGPALAAALTLLAGCTAAPDRVASAPPPVAAPAPVGPPRLIVAISVDQFSADLFAQYRQHYTGGLARLLQGGVFPSAFQSHAATETCPGHSTILTGAHPARTGIIANTWFDPGLARADKAVYCAEDETDPASSSRNPVVSAVHLRVPTLGDWLKQAYPASRNVAVSAKDRAVVMMGGHRIDEGWWYLKGQFVSLRGRTAPPAVTAANVALTAALKSGAPALPVPAWCAPRDAAVIAGKDVTVGQGRFALAPNQPDAFRVSPRMDAATGDLAARLAEDLRLGRGPAPDVLSVSFSATDYVGHAYGTEGLEMCIQMAELDRTIGALFARLDASGVDYLAVLTADHGGLDLPERLAQQGLPGAVRVDPALSPAALGKALAAELGLTVEGPLLYGDGAFGDFWVTKALPETQRARVAAALVARVRNHPQVAAVYTHDELARLTTPAGNPQDWTLRERARASFDAQRSGDVVILLNRAIVPIPAAGPGYVATHGSPWDYDRRVPLLVWRKGWAGFEQPAPVETVDIAPSLTAVLGLKVPEGSFDGRCLDLDGGPGNSCN
ncbi:alkaline phosphatase family protein [Novosphingobium piscinae]|uniref:Alkaline phosphatase n=1 Tax=Novosphingobium piscinae TaxID=1507448 RepID=A0A7X1G154_9SPHN|nr:alkaline phosphatase family protein [Novosphingobium piscinae]MBC2670705.1 alkaline phosphatase family protein [Novosphingobium piscinae]